MATPIWITGFEHGLAAPVTSGTGLFDAVAGTPAITVAAKRTGDYGLEITTAASTAEYVAKAMPSSQTTAVARFYLKVHSWVNDDWNNIFILGTQVGDSPAVVLNAAHQIGFLCAGSDPSTASYWSTPLTIDTWYRIDMKATISTTTYVINGQVDGNAVTQYSLAGRTASTYENVYIGTLSAGTEAQSLYYDDVVISMTSGDYPIGEGSVVGLRPNADGTHNNAANIMEDSAGNDIDGATYFAYDKLDENPWITTANADYVRQTANGATNYAEIQFADTTLGTIHGVQAVMQYASATATANDGEARIRDSDGQETVIYNGDMSETTAFYKSVIVTPPAGGWTTAYVNSLLCRMGYSGDADPDPYWLAFILEVSGSGTSATNVTVEPAVVTANATIPSSTISGDALNAPNALVTQSVVNEPTVSAEVIELVESDITLRLSVSAVTIIGSAAIAAAVLAGSLGINAPTIGGKVSVTPTPPTSHVLIVEPETSGSALETVNAINASFSIPTPTITGDALVAPSVLSGNLALIGTTVDADVNVRIPSDVISTSIPAPTIVGDSLHAPAHFSRQLAIGSPTVIADVKISPTVLSRRLYLQASTIATDIVLGANENVGTFSIPTPTITTTVGGLPLARTGYSSFSGSSNSGSQNITIPSDTTLTVLFIHGYNAGGNEFTTITIGGDTMTLLEGTNFGGTYEDTWIYYKAYPDVGTVNFAWNFTGSSVFTNGCWFNFIHVKNQDTSSPFRDYGTDSSTPGSITLDALEHDYVIGGACSSGGDANAAPASSGQTEFLDTASFNSVESACGDEYATTTGIDWTYTGAGTKSSGGAVSITPTPGIMIVAPNAVALSGSIPAPTIIGDSLHAPAHFTRYLQLNEPEIVVTGEPTESIVVFPSALVASSSLPTPTATGTALVEPDYLDGVFSIPTPTLISGFTHTPIALTGNLSIPTVTAKAEVVEVVNVVIGTFDIPTPYIISEGDVSVSTNAVVVSGVLPTPSVLTDAILSDTSRVLTATIPTPTLVTESVIVPTALVVTASIPTTSIFETSVISPTVLVGSLTLPTATISGDSLYSPSELVGTLSIPTPTLQGNEQTVTPDVVNLDAVVADPTIYSQVYTSLHAVRFYLGSSSGVVYECASSKKGDAGTAILAYWQTKNLDFSDQNDAGADLFKTIERVKLFYVDTNATDVTISVSADDGATWTDVTNSIGTGTNEPQEANFDFWLTGREFRFKIEHSSSSDNFQWTRMETVYATQGEHFEVT